MIGFFIPFPPLPQSRFLSVVDTHIISGYIRLKKARYGTVSNLLALKNLKIKKTVGVSFVIEEKSPGSLEGS